MKGPAVVVLEVLQERGFIILIQSQTETHQTSATVEMVKCFPQ